MGDFAKKWMAGLGAAAVVTVFAVIGIGKMERRSTPPASDQTAVTEPAVSPGAQAQARRSPMGATGQASVPPEVEPTEIQNEKASPAHSQNAADRLDNPQQRVVSETGSSGSPSRVVQGSKIPAVSSSGAPVQVARPAVPVAPPDVATQTTQLLQADTKPVTMQVSQPEGMTVTGNVNVDGEFSKYSRIVYPNDQVLTPGQNGALVTAKQSAVALGTNTQFKPDTMNSFVLDAGASNVSTKTGMTATMKGNWRVRPVHPDAPTQYEVNYESDGIYVYARVNDVDVINDPCRRTLRVPEGKAIRIPAFKACGVYWLDEGGRTWPYKAAWGGAAGAGTGVVIWLATHQRRPDLSPVRP